MTMKFTNNASADLASSITSGATSLTVAAGFGALFPSLGAGDYFFVTLIDPQNNLEIVRVTARSGDVFTIQRAQDGTTARAYAAGAKVELRPVAAGMSIFAQLNDDQTFSGANTFSGGTSFTGTVSSTQTISGSITGNAGTVTNGVYTTGNQTIGGVKTFSSAPVVPANSFPLTAIAQIATTSLLGRSTAGTGNIETLTGASIRSVLGTGTADGNTFLRGDGQWSFAGGLQGIQVFTASGTFTVPDGVTRVKVTVIGGGGGGGSTGTGGALSSSGGGGGGVAIKYITGLTPGETIAVTVGAGGAANTSGGTSSFGAFCSATGGTGGATNTTSSRAGGTATGGDINIPGGPSGVGGSASVTFNTGYGTATANAAAGGGGGGAGGGAGGNAFGAAGSTSSAVAIWGSGSAGIMGRGGSGGSGANGGAATGFGNGGGGAGNGTVSTARTGGSGTAGAVIVEY